MTMDENLFEITVEQLAQVGSDEERMGLRVTSNMPSSDAIREMMTLVRSVMFPGFFDRMPVTERTRRGVVSVDTEKIMYIAAVQIARGLTFCCDKSSESAQVEAYRMAEKFIARLPEIRRLLLTDVEAVAKNDPAVSSFGEVIFSYPVIQVMTHYRTAHALYELGVPIIPRIITEQAHSLTGIDIHPAAQIGEYFAIDHGTGVVIGATTIIGSHVMLYQGVTLGAKNFNYDTDGHPVDEPRHPIIEDNVTIYSNSSILGRITIGHDTVIGGNVWLTRSVPPFSRIMQGKPISEYGFADGAGI